MEIEIEFKGIKLLVGGTYIPPEEPVRYYNDMTGHPGSNSDFDINEIFVQETDIYELFGEKDLETIKDLTIEKIEGRLMGSGWRVQGYGAVGNIYNAPHYHPEV